jgi:hypothetical protein
MASRFCTVPRIRDDNAPDCRVAAQWTTANMTWQNTVARICNTLHVILAHVGPPSLRITSSLSEPSHEALQKKSSDTPACDTSA